MGSNRKSLVHPSPDIYWHVINGTEATDRGIAMVSRWRSALMAPS
jgi:hypothetical protein